MFSKLGESKSSNVVFFSQWHRSILQIDSRIVEPSVCNVMQWNAICKQVTVAHPNIKYCTFNRIWANEMALRTPSRLTLGFYSIKSLLSFRLKKKC